MLLVSSMIPEAGGLDEEVEDSLPKWKGKEKAIAIRTGVNSIMNELPNESRYAEFTVDWTQYEPPRGLTDNADSKSDLVKRIIQESIDKVTANIIEERQNEEDEAKKLRGEDGPVQENEKTVDDTVVQPLDEKPNGNNSPLEASTSLREDADNRGDLLEPPPKSKKRTLINILRRLNNAGEKGESSSTAAARHKHNASQSSFEAKARSAKKLLKRATDSNSSSSSQAEIECVSCLEDFSSKDMVKVPCHSYCKPCFRRLINTACENEQQWPPKCCLNTIPTKTVILNVDKGLKRTYYDRAAEWDLPVSDRVYCGDPNCSLWVRPYEINRERNAAKCHAGHWTCIICHAPEHEGYDCPQDRDMIKIDELAGQEGWKRCYGCRAYVEHKEACQHMTCRCGAEFCYVCGARWRTCDCTMEQLAAVKKGAEARRQARQDQEFQEEVELQEALRLIEELEREEAIKAEMLRQEEERLAEERRAKLIEEQIRQACERRQAIEVKYSELREIFVNVHELQRIIVQRDHDTEERNIESKGSTELVQLQGRHSLHRTQLKATRKINLAGKYEEFEKEHALRVAAEHRIKEQYYTKLREYWTGRKNGETEIETAMEAFNKKMDEGFEKWEKWASNELTKHRWATKEEYAIQKELMQAAERRLEESTREEMNGFFLRKTAELRWVDVVIEERARMLDDMETDEIENGVNIESWFDAEDGLNGLMDFPEEFQVPGAFRD
ncbi:hypothetical protein M426DRAFT_319332 [Hypoxylon sp. CI-4A]|nr:hypothetical protein M426DRAFT_319332 [Hypoxylon sp. CI-4A]